MACSFASRITSRHATLLSPLDTSPLQTNRARPVRVSSVGRREWSGAISPAAGSPQGSAGGRWQPCRPDGWKSACLCGVMTKRRLCPSSFSAAQFSFPKGLAVDSSGNIYVADTTNHKIRKVTPAGVVTSLAGSAVSGSADGTGSAAQFGAPIGIAVDSDGNVYAADTYSCTIRKVTPGGDVTTLAGSAGNSGSSDGTGSAARFNPSSAVRGG